MRLIAKTPKGEFVELLKFARDPMFAPGCWLFVNRRPDRHIQQCVLEWRPADTRFEWALRIDSTDNAV